MSWLSLAPWLGTVIFGIAGAIGIWYYRNRALDSEGDQTLLKLAITNANTATLAAQAEAKTARDALTAKLQEIHVQDQSVATAADSAAAAVLLDQLHSNG